MRQKSQIYTPKRDDEHPHPFHMGSPSPSPSTPAGGIEELHHLILYVPNCFLGIWDFPYLKAEIRGLKEKMGQHSGLKVCMHGMRDFPYLKAGIYRGLKENWRLLWGVHQGTSGDQKVLFSTVK